MRKRCTDLSYRIDLYFVEFGMKYKEKKIEEKIENILGCTFIRFSLDRKNVCSS